jgi:hypothetical protein
VENGFTVLLDTSVRAPYLNPIVELDSLDPIVERLSVSDVLAELLVHRIISPRPDFVVRVHQHLSDFLLVSQIGGVSLILTDSHHATYLCAHLIMDHLLAALDASVMSPLLTQPR